MILPSLACQASCKYCFGPHAGATMDEGTAAATIAFIRRIAEETQAREIAIIFHGGEPLLAPLTVWRTLLAEIEGQLAAYELRLNLQSNLWALSDEHLELFDRYHVALGTSLDGPRELCDRNRGAGYYDRTMAAVHRAARHGKAVSAIATITRQTLPHLLEIATYFRDSGQPLALHAALPSLGDETSPYALLPGEYAQMIKTLFPWYLANRKHLKIDTLDHFAQGLVHGDPGVCTFRDCLGMFLALGPTGDISACQRLAGLPEHRLGNICDGPTWAELYASEAARRHRAREAEVRSRCAACESYDLCKGGCYYNALAAGDGVIDPLCQDYREIYAATQERIVAEMSSSENVAAVAAGPPEADEHPLLRRGPTISLAGTTHPATLADNARRILAIHALGETGDPERAAQNLYAQKICGDVDFTTRQLSQMQKNLYASHRQKNNCYLHVTWGCNLRCSHCYAAAGEKSAEMTAASFASLVAQASDQGFRQLVITGGEPTVHSRWEELVNTCRGHRGRGPNLVLRTNLTKDFTTAELTAIAQAFDQVVVSVDGNEDTHNTRRGAGTYAKLRTNLETYADIARRLPNAGELSLACVMPAEDINGEPGRSVKALAEALGVKRVRFKPLLPLGRAAGLDEPVICEGFDLHSPPRDLLKESARPLSTCGIGQNLYVQPDGGAYPCYAWCHAHTYLGNVSADGLAAVLTSPKFQSLINCTVDTIEKCRDCAYRYLCGGACRAWGNQQEQDLNAPPPVCSHLGERAKRVVRAAREYLLEL